MYTVPYLMAGFICIIMLLNKKISLFNNNRLIFKRNDKCKTHFMNVLISKITECYSKIEENYSEFILKVQNIYYKITVIN